MKIGLDASILEYEGMYRGISRYTICLMEALLREDGKDEYLIYKNREDPTLKYTHSSRIHLYNTRRRSITSPILRSWKGVRHQVLIPFQFYRKGVDVVYSFTHRYAALFTPGKHVVTVLDVIPELYPEVYLKYIQQRMISRRWKNVARRADVIITISEASKADIVRIYGVDPGKVHVIYPGYEQDLFMPLPSKETRTYLSEKYCLNGDYILYVGGFDHRKNLAMLLQSFSELKERNGITHRLVIVGEASPEEKSRLYSMIKETGIEKDVLLMGFVPKSDLPVFYSGADLFVFPSLYEGFGLPVLEAMACGTPVIALNTSSIPEVVGNAAVLVKAGDHREWNDRMLRLIQDNGLRCELKKRGIEQAKKYSWELTARKTLQLFESV